MDLRVKIGRTVMKFIVEFTLTSLNSIEIEAGSEHDAKEKVLNMSMDELMDGQEPELEINDVALSTDPSMVLN